MRIFIFIVLLFNTLYCFSQQKVTIEGKIVTDEGQGIPYANIIETCGKYGVATDSKGYFELEIKGNINKQKLKISALGYGDTIINCRMLNINNLIVLKEKPIVLNEYVIEYKKKSKKYILGAKSYSKIDIGHTGLYPGMQRGLYIPNNYENPLKIKRIEVYVTKHGKPNTPFRLRVYNIDTITKLPGDDLLATSYISKSKHGREWLKFDLTQEHLYLPQQGFVVAVEWINCGDEYFYKMSEESNYKYYGIVLGTTRKIKPNYSYIYAFNKEWHQIQLPDELTITWNLAIRVICYD